MAGQRQPIELILAKGKKNLTKAEIAERRASEVQPCTDEIVAPSYLTASQRKRFDKLAGQLAKIKIMGETDAETLARYVTAEELYEQAVKDLRKAHKQQQQAEDLAALSEWADLLESLDKRVDRYYKQSSALARDLGLTISSRCRLQVPVSDEEPKVNKFAKFEKKKAVAGE